MTNPRCQMNQLKCIWVRRDLYPDYKTGTHPSTTEAVETMMGFPQFNNLKYDIALRNRKPVRGQCAEYYKTVRISDANSIVMRIVSVLAAMNLARNQWLVQVLVSNWLT